MLPAPLHQAALADAARYLPHGDPDARLAFATRQWRARERYTQLVTFYRRNPCRVARVHLLTGAAVTLGRFCGLSKSFDDIGEAVMPVDATGAPTTAAWRAYADGCASGLPWDLRDDLWMVAHLEDMERVRVDGLDRAFDAEAQTHRADPLWTFLRLHMEMTLGARLIDHLALAGQVPHETALADGIATSLTRIARTGLRLLTRYAREGTRAVLWPSSESTRSVISYRRTALQMLRFSLSAWTSARVFRRGVRNRDRGRVATGDAWTLLAPVLGERTREVHPLIIRFYGNPSGFTVRCSLELHTTAARFWSFLAATLLGQGLYEAGSDVSARFKVFRRTDGSMHFVRELVVGGALAATFDSDFLVREHRGRPTFFEVFPDLGVAVAMSLSVLPGGGLAIRGAEVLMRRWRLPMFGLVVEFRSEAVDGPSGTEVLINGHLRMEPSSRFGRFIAYRVLRRPVELGCIRYRATPTVEASLPLPSQLTAAP